MDALEYFFGTGDGATSTWHSPADLDLNGDGVLDAVALDFDGDGRIDDAMWDSDGDGVADRAVLDLDDDGVPERFFRDSGLGLWEQSVPGAPAGHQSTPPSPGRLEIDADGDGRPEAILEDTDGDGYADRVVEPD
ncbi:hypothetical protein [Gordonia caeni]|uniref:Pullulanase n=1 Tax=Gordonia caeni TaxID=1007097 RepID=A0ABP7NKK4_9ACTN